MSTTQAKKVACRKDWKTKPMPKRREIFILKRSFSDKEMEYYKKLSGTDYSAMLKIKSGEVKEVINLFDLKYWEYEFNLE